MGRWPWPPFWADSSPSPPAASRLKNFNDPRDRHTTVPAPASFRLDPCRRDHLPPFRVVVADDLGVGHRRGADHLDADRGHALVEARRGDRRPIARLSVATMSAGVPAGATRPTPEPTSTPGKAASAIVGTSGSVAIRSLPATASAVSLPSLISGNRELMAPMN